MIKNNIYKDDLTNMPNFIQFMKEDFSEMFGENGCIVQVRIEPLQLINAKYGYEIGSKYLKFVGQTMKEYSGDYPCYRNEGNGFILILKDGNCPLASNLIKALKSKILFLNEKFHVREASIDHMVITYDRAIRSLADYYVLILDEYRKKTDGESDEDIMHRIINTISYRVLDTVNSYIKTHEYALHDDVSNLPNSKSAKLMFENIDEHYNRYGVLFIDGDSLSKFNKVSYEEGNNAIKSIASVIKNSIRKTDHVFRWLSGDEFVVVTEYITGDEVKQLAERIRENIEIKGRDLLFPATVSIGVACCPNDALDIDEIMKCAELANKEAKAKGKNVVMYYGETEISRIYS